MVSLPWSPLMPASFAYSLFVICNDEANSKKQLTEEKCMQTQIKNCMLPIKTPIGKKANRTFSSTEKYSISLITT